MKKRVALAFIHASIVELDLDPFTLKVYLFLHHRSNRDGFTFQSAKSIAEATRISQTKTKDALRELAEKRLIARVTKAKSKGGSSSKYYLADRDEWLASRISDGSRDDPSETDPTGHVTTPDGSRDDPSHIEGKKPVSKKPNKGGGESAFRPSEPIPKEWLDDVDFLLAWDDWEATRPKRSNTVRAAELASSKLAALTLSGATECLNESVANGWRGLFPDKFEKGSGKAAREFSQTKRTLPTI